MTWPSLEPSCRCAVVEPPNKMGGVEGSDQNCFISVPNCWFNMLVSLSYGGFPRISVALVLFAKSHGLFCRNGGSTFTKHEAPKFA